MSEQQKYWRIRYEMTRTFGSFNESIFVSAPSMKAAKKKAEELFERWKRGNKKDMENFFAFQIHNSDSVEIIKVESVDYTLISQYEIY